MLPRRKPPTRHIVKIAYDCSVLIIIQRFCPTQKAAEAFSSPLAELLNFSSGFRENGKRLADGSPQEKASCFSSFPGGKDFFERLYSACDQDKRKGPGEFTSPGPLVTSPASDKFNLKKFDHENF
ncbi:hypothetical protein [uncultured Oscillibacter sp.]|uniref:hypothetical protein n=1 Tax=uncultured Oscillibacter sp. TaxID=876091 RepID=UPI0025CF7AD9|nr:hypothetical protein [uncultured Oscillibacter sp.]